MPRMQRTGQRPCADVSALRRTSHRHHQTETKSGFDWSGHPVRRCVADRSFISHFLAFHNGQGFGPASKHATAVPATLNSARRDCIDISPTACRVMAKRLRDVCGLPESEPLWRAGRGFVVRDLPWTVEKLRVIPPFEFENWAVIALGGIPKATRVNSIVRWQPTATGNPPAATSVARCVADFPANPFPNPPATAP